MTVLNFRILTSVLLLTGSMATVAATIDITAEFSPSMDNPENNLFKNTTPQSGYCVYLPNQCKENQTFSISLGGLKATLATQGFQANSEPRDSMYFKMPGAWRKVMVRSSEGYISEIEFRVSAYSAYYYTLTDWTWGKHHQAWDGLFMYPPAPCRYSGVGTFTERWYGFMWKWPTNDAACYRIPVIDLTGEPHLIDYMSIGYELKTPNPLQLAGGVYAGQLKLSVGPGGDFDFGDNFQTSDSMIDINFTLSVNHELKITTTPENQKVTLQPCSADKVCTEDDGKANWERWMITRVTPQLTGRSNFNISSSGSFHVYLQCEQQSGSDCALKSDNSSRLVPIQTLLTLPENIGFDKSGGRVIRKKLYIGKEASKTHYSTKSLGQNKKGSIDFLVNQRDVDTMLQSRPDTYRGAVTVIFDPNLY